MTRCTMCNFKILKGVEQFQGCPNGHIVHSVCLKGWLRHSSSCPLCSIPYSARVILQSDSKILSRLNDNDIPWIKCPDCRRKLTKKEFFIHSCKKNSYLPGVQHPRSPLSLRTTIMRKLKRLFSRRVQSEQLFAQVPEEENKEEENIEEENKDEQPRLSNEDIMILDLESEEGINLIKQYEEEIGERATQRGKETKKFITWIKGEEVETLNACLLREREESVKDYRESFLKKNVRESFLRKGRNWRGGGDDKYPYPYVFKPPEPPDDFAMTPQSQLRVILKEKDHEEVIHCQYCGKELTKEEQFTHSCKKKPKNT